VTAKIFHPLLALIASATNNELAKYVQYLKEENRILRARIPGQVHTKPAERERLLKFGKLIGRAIEELMTIVSPATFYRWVRDADSGQGRVQNSKGGQRKPRKVRELVIQIARATGFMYTRIIGEFRKLGIKKIRRQPPCACGSHPESSHNNRRWLEESRSHKHPAARHSIAHNP